MSSSVQPHSRSSPYHYRPLEAHYELRLIKVSREETAPKHGHRPTYRYEIIHADLDTSTPSYQTVSYVWGVGSRDERLFLSSGAYLLITTTLVTAIHLLSEHCSTGYLWVDQICHPTGPTGRYLACFHQLLCWNRKFLCSESVTLRSQQSAGPEFKSAILALPRIEYSIETKDFYTIIARCVLSSARYLDLLVSAGIQNSESQTKGRLLSWVLNYLETPKYRVFFARGAQDLDAGLCEERESATFKIQDLYLLCEGSMFDIVEDTLDIEAITFKLYLLQFCTTFPSYIGGRQRLEVLWRTLLLDETDNGTTPAPKKLSSGFLAMAAGYDGQKRSKLKMNELDNEQYYFLLGNYLGQLNATEVLGEDAL
jgi:hypothetical protein